MAGPISATSIAALTKEAISAITPLSNQCRMCQKEGMPILPVRYSALAATRAHGIDGVPLVSGNFGAHVQGVASARAKYTLRSLRKGFVYVFYMKMMKWQCYAVTDEGNCYECPLEKPFSCTPTGNSKQPHYPGLAQCIAIDRADRVGTVYLAFSEVQWTKAVRDAYAADRNSCRTLRMQPFNASAWFKKPGEAPHAASATRVQQLVSEYKGGEPCRLPHRLFRTATVAARLPRFMRRWIILPLTKAKALFLRYGIPLASRRN